MQRLDLTLPTAAENVALDEALLDWAEATDPALEYLRIWESSSPAVVMGRSSRVELEVNQNACRELAIPLIRRSSGGAAIVAGPGCLMYALVLSYQLRPELKDIRRAHTEVLNRIAHALQHPLRGIGIVAQAGTSDLVFVPSPSEHGAVRGQATQLTKFAGNSLRAKRSHMLYHGTLLYNFDLHLIETCLLLPPRQPDYRNRRRHGDFVTNLPCGRTSLVDALDNAWPTESEVRDWPAERTAELVATRFGQDRWNLEFP